jgi:signal transduction histidine kinase
VAAVLTAAGVLLGVAVTTGFPKVDDALWLCFLSAAPVTAGRAIRSRVLPRDELRAMAERLEAERETAARQAAEDERARIAGELQAAVANSVSAMVVQAEAIQRVLAAGDTARARDSFELIETTGRSALAEMRRLLGVLRREGEQPKLAPQPGLGRLDALVQDLREAGLDVQLLVEGERRPLAPGADLSAYRVLQQALELATAQDASRITVTLRYGDRDLEFEVVDDRAGDDGETGIAPLRDRVGLYGGRLRAGSRDGGFALVGRLPLGDGALASARSGS